MSELKQVVATGLNEFVKELVKEVKAGNTVSTVNPRPSVIGAPLSARRSPFIIETVGDENANVTTRFAGLPQAIEEVTLAGVEIAQVKIMTALASRFLTAPWQVTVVTAVLGVVADVVVDLVEDVVEEATEELEKLLDKDLNDDGLIGDDAEEVAEKKAKKAKKSKGKK